MCHALQVLYCEGRLSDLHSRGAAALWILQSRPAKMLSTGTGTGTGKDAKHCQNTAILQYCNTEYYNHGLLSTASRPSTVTQLDFYSGRSEICRAANIGDKTGANWGEGSGRGGETGRQSSNAEEICFESSRKRNWDLKCPCYDKNHLLNQRQFLILINIPLIQFTTFAPSSIPTPLLM